MKIFHLTYMSLTGSAIEFTCRCETILEAFNKLYDEVGTEVEVIKGSYSYAG